MPITYPRPTGENDYYKLYKVSTDKILEHRIRYPRVDGGEIQGGDPDLVYLHIITGSRVPDYDSRLFREIGTPVIDLDNGTHTTTFTLEQRSVEEISESIENMEASFNAQIIENNKRDKYLLLGVGLCLHQLDGQSLNDRQNALRTLILDRAVKMWKNDNVADQLKALVQGGNQPDLDGAPWENQ
jgi:hypothetical protein